MKNYLAIIILNITYHLHAQTISSKEILIAPSVFIEVVEHNCEKANHSLKLIAKGSDKYSSIQWQVSKDNIVWEDIIKEKSIIVKLPVQEKDNYYRVVCSPITPKESINVLTISNILTLSCMTKDILKK